MNSVVGPMEPMRLSGYLSAGVAGCRFGSMFRSAYFFNERGIGLSSAFVIGKAKHFDQFPKRCTDGGKMDSVG